MLDLEANNIVSSMVAIVVATSVGNHHHHHYKNYSIKTSLPFVTISVTVHHLSQSISAQVSLLNELNGH